MICSSDVYALVENEFPALRQELQRIDDKKSTFKTLKCFIEFTLKNLKNRDFRSAMTCIRLAEKLFGDGDRQVRFSFEMVYLAPLHQSGKPNNYFVTQISSILAKDVNASSPQVSLKK